MVAFGATHKDVRDANPSSNPDGKLVMSFPASSLNIINMQEATRKHKTNDVLAFLFEAMQDGIGHMIGVGPVVVNRDTFAYRSRVVGVKQRHAYTHSLKPRGIDARILQWSGSRSETSTDSG